MKAIKLTDSYEHKRSPVLEEKINRGDTAEVRDHDD